MSRRTPRAARAELKDLLLNSAESRKVKTIDQIKEMNNAFASKSPTFCVFLYFDYVFRCHDLG